MASKSKGPQETNPRLVKRGDAVVVKGMQKQAEVVRDVSIVLHLANGRDEVYQADELVKVVPNPDDELVEKARQLLEKEK